MTKRQLTAGIVISLLFPGLLYFILKGIEKLSTNAEPNDFQYHDSYFIVFHLTAEAYLVLSLFIFIIYLIGILLFKAIKAAYKRGSRK